MMDFASYLTESKSFLAPVNNSNLVNLSSVCFHSILSSAPSQQSKFRFQLTEEHTAAEGSRVSLYRNCLTIHTLRQFHWFFFPKRDHVATSQRDLHIHSSPWQKNAKSKTSINENVYTILLCILSTFTDFWSNYEQNSAWQVFSSLPKRMQN